MGSRDAFAMNESTQVQSRRPRPRDISPAAKPVRVSNPGQGRRAPVRHPGGPRSRMMRPLVALARKAWRWTRRGGNGSAEADLSGHRADGHDPGRDVGLIAEVLGTRVETWRGAGSQRMTRLQSRRRAPTATIFDRRRGFAGFQLSRSDWHAAEARRTAIDRRPHTAATR